MPSSVDSHGLNTLGESLKRGHTDSDSAEEEEELWSKMDVITTEQMHPSTKTKSEWKWILLRDIVKVLCMCGHTSSAKITISITTKQKISLLGSRAEKLISQGQIAAIAILLADLDFVTQCGLEPKLWNTGSNVLLSSR